MKIINATINNLDQVAALFDAYRVFYRQSSDLVLAREFIEARLINNDSTILLAIDDSQQDFPGVGYVQLYYTFSSIKAKSIIILNDLFVMPEYRGQNVGRELMRAAKQQAIASGIETLILATEHTNVIGQQLYESEGYEKNTSFIHYILTVTK